MGRQKKNSKSKAVQKAAKSTGFCRLCYESVRSRKAEHVWFVHMTCKPFRCTNCEYRSKYIDVVVGHMRSQHDLVRGKPEITRANYENAHRRCFSCCFGDQFEAADVNNNEQTLHPANPVCLRCLSGLVRAFEVNCSFEVAVHSSNWCQLCSTAADNGPQLANSQQKSRHVWSNHMIVKCFACPMCHNSFVRLDGANHHIANLHNSNEEAVDLRHCYSDAFRETWSRCFGSMHVDEHNIVKISDESCFSKIPLVSIKNEVSDDEEFNKGDAVEGISNDGRAVAAKSCRVCRRKVAKNWKERHIWMSHMAGYKSFGCSVCDYRSSCKSSVTRHLVKFHQLTSADGLDLRFHMKEKFERQKELCFGSSSSPADRSADEVRSFWLESIAQVAAQPYRDLSMRSLLHGSVFESQTTADKKEQQPLADCCDEEQHLYDQWTTRDGLVYSAKTLPGQPQILNHFVTE